MRQSGLKSCTEECHSHRLKSKKNSPKDAGILRVIRGLGDEAERQSEVSVKPEDNSKKWVVKNVKTNKTDKTMTEMAAEGRPTLGKRRHRTALREQVREGRGGRCWMQWKKGM